MADRRTLIDGLKQTPAALDPALEKSFVFQNKKPGEGGTQTIAPVVSSSPNNSRSPISTRIRTDFTSALKRASLERQLSGAEPNTLQDILEEAIEPWLKSNGYLE